MAGRWDLTEAQWEIVAPVLEPSRRADHRGRPWQDTRAVLHGVLWVLGTGAHWSELPSKYPPYQTCHRRFQQWVRDGRLVESLRVLAHHLRERGKLNLEEAFVDATFASAKKKGFAVGRTRRGKGTKIVAIASGDGLPLAVTVDSASPAECKLWSVFWQDASPINSRHGSSETKPTTRTRSTARSKKTMASN